MNLGESSMSSNTNNKSNKDNQIKCIICNKDHFFSFCNIFLNKTILERKEFVANKHSCFNYLGLHMLPECKSEIRCKFCQKNHHFTLHFSNQSDDNNISQKFESNLNKNSHLSTDNRNAEESLQFINSDEENCPISNC